MRYHKGIGHLFALALVQQCGALCKQAHRGEGFT
jgi:hypothetical protein